MKRVDRKTLESILNAYADQEDLVLPDEMALDDLQQQFARGFLCAQQKKSDGFETEDEEIRQQILQVRSKYCEPILELLFHEGELYHGDLADKLDLSPSGLNAIIKKMMEGITPIIDMMQIGKYKIYTLPDAVRRYMVRRTQPKEERLTKEKVDEDNPVLALQNFAEMTGRKWKDTLSLLLQGKDDDADKDVKSCFMELINLAKQAQIYDADSYTTLRNALQNDILAYLLDEYIAELKECDQIMEEIKRRENGRKLIRHFKMQ